MNRRRFCQWLLGTLSTAAVSQQLLAAPPVTTVIEVHNMHCADCARRIARKLYAVPGVVGVRTNVAANTATISPQQRKQPSPKAMWEAVEKAGFKPLRLEGPYGTFVSKPSA
jgi:copper chaperone CopZ